MTSPDSVAQQITSSGLNTAVSGPIALPSGQTQFNITGGTRPGGGTNLFHSFGNFSVPNNNIANFLNDSGLATSNILSRVTGGNVSNIFGTIQTTGFGNANLFLMNPAGIIFGPTATLNVGGMATFTTADYLRLADGVHFKAIPHASTDALLSAAPVAAFGFLGSNPAAITVQGSHLTVAEGTGISLVGGNITIQDGTLTAPSGQVNLISVGKPSHRHTGGQVVVAGQGQDPGFIPTGFKTLGTINLSQGSTLETSAIAGSGHTAGRVFIRGGQFVMDASSIEAVAPPRQSSTGTAGAGGNIEVTAEQVALSNHSSIDTRISNTGSGGSAGNITFNVNSFSASDSAIGAFACCDATAGSVTIQGLQGSGTSAHSVSLTNTQVDTSNFSLPSGSGISPNGGPILIRANHMAVNESRLSAISEEGNGGPITLVSRGGIESQNSLFSTVSSMGGDGGTVGLTAGAKIDLSGMTIRVDSLSFNGGTITMAAPFISIRGSTLDANGGGLGAGGSISLTARDAVRLTNGTVLSADSTGSFIPHNLNGGTILINGGGHFTGQQSTISAQSLFGNGGTINVEAKKVVLTDSQLLTSVSGGPQTHGGTIAIDAHKAIVKNSDVLSRATEGHAGEIVINGGHLFTTEHSTISAESALGNGGTLNVEAHKVVIQDSKLESSAPGGPQAVGGTVNIDAHKAIVKNSDILSTATAGQGGTITITTPTLSSTGSHINATSQSGTDGTVIIQP